MFMAYNFFVIYLLNEFSELDKHIGNFIIRSIIHSTIYAINIVFEHPKELATVGNLCCKILEKLVSLISAFASICTEIAFSLSFVVVNLTNLCCKHQTEEELITRIISILESIVCSQKNDLNQFDLITAVAGLDDFPDNKMFSKLIEHLQGEKEKQPSSSIENVSVDNDKQHCTWNIT